MLVKEIYFVCRTCLKIGTNFFNLFNFFEDGIALSDMLLECITTQAQEDDELPSHICSECKNTLYSFWAFKSLALQTEAKLRNNTKTPGRNGEPDVIKSETVEISSDNAVQVQCSDPFIFKDYSESYELFTNNTEDSIDDTSDTYEEKYVIDYLGEPQCKNEITVIKNDVKICQNDLVVCSTNLDHIDTKSVNLEVNIDNKTLTDTEKGQYFETACNNNEKEAVLTVKRLKHKLSRKLEQNSLKECKKLRLNRKCSVKETHECEICEKVFMSRSGLEAHIEGHIESLESRPVCELCGKVFLNVYTLGAHYETHNTERTAVSYPT